MNVSPLTTWPSSDCKKPRSILACTYCWESGTIQASVRSIAAANISRSSIRRAKCSFSG